MLNNFSFSFREEEFRGLKFKSDIKFSDGYFDNLLQEGSHYSEIKYADGMDSQTLESIHIKLSYALALKIISVVFLIVAVILWFIKLILPSVMLIITGAVMLMINIYLTHKSNELYALRDATRSMIKMMFENRS
ncbi:MAG TPA: hypothetical protein PLV06_06135 [Bacteroidales bacterium]|nr:hypothetical protein [Bacteroidales bacterium]HPJ58797.1 hypothetical protein [Bacteroidales bacterium]HPR11947.1 hypothetical protein [Bacteroidales bacterium]HRW85761.1 hypothetical protein [Bacteroidales bacterium]